VRPLQIFTNVWAHYLRVLFYICKCIHSFVQSKLWRLGHHLQGLDLNSISKAEDMKKLYHFNRFHGILVRIKKSGFLSPVNFLHHLSEDLQFLDTGVSCDYQPILQMLHVGRYAKILFAPCTNMHLMCIKN
jgi:hypothetical protein